LSGEWTDGLPDGDFAVLQFLLVGGVAQLGERRVRNAKVGSSILLLSTNKIPSNAKVLRENPAGLGSAGFFVANCNQVLPVTTIPNPG
jgi:hypothetical protein